MEGRRKRKKERARKKFPFALLPAYPAYLGLPPIPPFSPIPPITISSPFSSYFVRRSGQAGRRNQRPAQRAQGESQHAEGEGGEGGAEGLRPQGPGQGGALRRQERHRAKANVEMNKKNVNKGNLCVYSISLLNSFRRRGRMRGEKGNGLHTLTHA